MSVMKWKVTNEKKRNGGSLNEGKSPMIFTLYKKIYDIICMGDGDKIIIPPQLSRSIF